MRTGVVSGGLRSGLFGRKPDLTSTLAADPVPEFLVLEQADLIHAGLCPHCEGPGPVDFYTSHWVRSFVVVMQHGTHEALACRRCRNQRLLLDTTTTVATGWFGFHGLLMTPVQLARNGWSFVAGWRSATPSKRLIAVVRANLQQVADRAALVAVTWPCSACGERLPSPEQDDVPQGRLCKACAADSPGQWSS